MHQNLYDKNLRKMKRLFPNKKQLNENNLKYRTFKCYKNVRFNSE